MAKRQFSLNVMSEGCDGANYKHAKKGENKIVRNVYKGHCKNRQNFEFPEIN